LLARRAPRAPSIWCVTSACSARPLTLHACRPGDHTRPGVAKPDSAMAAGEAALHQSRGSAAVLCIVGLARGHPRQGKHGKACVLHAARSVWRAAPSETRTEGSPLTAWCGAGCCCCCRWCRSGRWWRMETTPSRSSSWARTPAKMSRTTSCWQVRRRQHQGGTCPGGRSSAQMQGGALCVGPGGQPRGQPPPPPPPPPPCSIVCQACAAQGGTGGALR
jgi:hypothetical protein